MGASTVKWGVARTIVWAWILTIPVSALIGFTAFAVIRVLSGTDFLSGRKNGIISFCQGFADTGKDAVLPT